MMVFSYSFCYSILLLPHAHYSWALFAIFLFDLHLLSIVPSRANKLALQVIDVALAVEQVLLLVTLDLNATQAFLRQVLRIVHIDHVVVFTIAIHFTISFHIHHTTYIFLIASQHLTFSHALVVEIAVRLLILFLEDLLALLTQFVLQVGAP